MNVLPEFKTQDFYILSFRAIIDNDYFAIWISYVLKRFEASYGILEAVPVEYYYGNFGFVSLNIRTSVA